MFPEMTIEQVTVMRIRSIYKTVDNYRRTSVALHGHPTKSVRDYGRQQSEIVRSMLENFPDDPNVQRQGQKFLDYVKSHGLE